MIHPTAIVHRTAVVGKNVEIGPFSIIHGNVELSDNVVVQERVTIGNSSDSGSASLTFIGRHSTIRSGAVIYEDVLSGHGLHIGHNVVIRAGARFGEECSIGSGSQIQGAATLGNRVRLHSNVHFGEMACVEDDVWIFSNVLITNDPNPPSHIRLGVTIGRETVVSAGVVFMPGVTVGPRAVILPMSKITRNYPDEDSLLGGSPAKLLGQTRALKMADNRSRAAYPWKDRGPS